MTMKAPSKPQNGDYEQGKLMAAVVRLEGAIETVAESVVDIVTRLDRIETRMDRRDDDYEEITGVTSNRDLELSARNLRAKAALEELQRKESEAKEHRSKLAAKIATGVAVLMGILQGLQLAGVLK